MPRLAHEAYLTTHPFTKNRGRGLWVSCAPRLFLTIRASGIGVGYTDYHGFFTLLLLVSVGIAHHEIQ